MGSHPAAQRMSDQVEAVEAQFIEKLLVVQVDVIKILKPIRHRSVTESGMLGNNDIGVSGHCIIKGSHRRVRPAPWK